MQQMNLINIEKQICYAETRKLPAGSKLLKNLFLEYNSVANKFSCCQLTFLYAALTPLDT